MPAKRTNTVPVKGDEIRRMRKTKGWTQQELADAAQVGLRTVVSLESGNPALPVATVQPVATALGVRRDELIDGREPPPPKKKEYFVVGMHRDGDFNDCDQTTDIPPWIDRLVEAVPDIDEYILIVRVRPKGSYIVDIEFADTGILSLLHAFNMNDLRHFAIRQLDIPVPFFCQPRSWTLGSRIRYYGYIEGFVKNAAPLFHRLHFRHYTTQDHVEVTMEDPALL